MMKFKNVSLALMLVAGLAVGCEESEDAVRSVGDAANDAAESAGDHSGDAMDSLKQKADEAGSALKEKGNEAVAVGKEKVDEAVAAGKEKLHDMTADHGTADEATAMSLDDLKPGMSLDAGQMDGIIAKVKGLIGEENYDLASQWISKLEGMELPEGYGEKLAGLKGLLEKAQGAGDMLKGLGG